MKTAALALSILAASVSLFAQENENKEKFRYSNITEFGFISASPKGISLEAITVQGFSIDKTHHLGLGLGMGENFYPYTETSYGLDYSYTETAPYMPVFLNYRFYFKPNKVFSPHINIALGGLLSEEMSGGFYSVLTMGFKAGKFSFSSGLSLMAINRTVVEYQDYWNEGYWREGYWYNGNWIEGWWIEGYWGQRREQKEKWFHPFGLVVKCGFTF
ncbi:MAG: hypothetical protein FWH36_01880 [Lentimicrobiaceae bacterium]|nr:hypothetical protein [Lentimicrobiaceae bacterium]